MKLPYILKATYPIATVMMKIHGLAVAMRALRSTVLAVCDTQLMQMLALITAATNSLSAGHNRQTNLEKYTREDCSKLRSFVSLLHL
jgi:hypothetical protein